MFKIHTINDKILIWRNFRPQMLGNKFVKYFFAKPKDVY